VTHSDRERVARCPICQGAIDQDHEEALGMQRQRTPAPPGHKAPPASPEPDVHEADAVVAFALV
jgi:hypothetical protein